MLALSYHACSYLGPLDTSWGSDADEVGLPAEPARCDRAPWKRDDGREKTQAPMTLSNSDTGFVGFDSIFYPGWLAWLALWWLSAVSQCVYRWH